MGPSAPKGSVGSGSVPQNPGNLRVMSGNSPQNQAFPVAFCSQEFLPSGLMTKFLLVSMDAQDLQQVWLLLLLIERKKNEGRREREKTLKVLYDFKYHFNHDFIKNTQDITKIWLSDISVSSSVCCICLE